MPPTRLRSRVRLNCAVQLLILARKPQLSCKPRNLTATEVTAFGKPCPMVWRWQMPSPVWPSCQRMQLKFCNSLASEDVIMQRVMPLNSQLSGQLESKLPRDEDRWCANAPPSKVTSENASKIFRGTSLCQLHHPLSFGRGAAGSSQALPRTSKEKGSEAIAAQPGTPPTAVWFTATVRHGGIY